MMDERGQFAAAALDAASRAHAMGVLERLHYLEPFALERTGLPHAQVAADVEILLRCLGQALACGVPDVFHQHCAWLCRQDGGHGLPRAFLHSLLTSMAAELQETLPEAVAAQAASVARAAASRLPAGGDETQDALSAAVPHRELAQAVLLAMLTARGDDAVRLVRDALRSGTDARDLLEQVVRPVQIEVGLLWRRGEIHVGEEHYASRTSERLVAALAEMAPRAPRSGRRVLTATVGGELHELGVRLVTARFELAGWDTVLLGASVPAGDLVRSAGDFGAHLVALSVSIALHLTNAARTIAALRVAHPALPIVVGGSLFGLVPELGRALGADAEASSSDEALAAAERLVPPP